MSKTASILLALCLVQLVAVGFARGPPGQQGQPRMPGGEASRFAQGGSGGGEGGAGTGAGGKMFTFCFRKYFFKKFFFFRRHQYGSWCWWWCRWWRSRRCRRWKIKQFQWLSNNFNSF